MEEALGSISFGSEIKPTTHKNKTQRKRSQQIANLNQNEEEDTNTKKKAAWVDEDDEDLVIDTTDKTITKKLRQKKKKNKISGKEFETQLRKQFETINPLPGWMNAKAKKEDSDSENDPEGLLTSAEPLVQKSHTLPDNFLKHQTFGVLDPHISSTSITSLQFHEDGEICLISGGNQVKFFNVQQKKSKEIIKFSLRGPKGISLPIKKAELFNRGSEVFLLSNLPSFHTIDLGSGEIEEHFSLKKEVAPKDLQDILISPETTFVFGRGGRIFCLDPKSKLFISELRANSEPTAFCFSPNYKYLYTAGTEGVISQWDLSMRKVVHKFTDEGSLHTTALSISSDGQWQAAGSSSGIVNIYDLKEVTEKGQVAPTPRKRIENMVTRIDRVLFNPTDQILAISSDLAVHNQRLRFAHVPSWKLFPNFPGKQQINTGRVFDFSPKSDVFASANGNKVHLFGLDHFRSGGNIL